MRGAAWVGSTRILVRLLGLCSTFVLARLLVPEDFGLVAIVTGIVGLLETFSELGFNQALIRFKDADDDDYATVWTLNLVRGAIISIILIFLSYPLSLGLDDNRLVLLFIVTASLPLISGLENPYLMVFEKKLQFDVLFRLMVITKIAGVVTTIGLAFLWRTYWVLIAGMIISAGMRTCLTYYYAPGKVKITVKSWHKLFGFSGWLAGAQMLRAIGNRLDPLILASFATPHIVGILHIAREMSSMAFMEIAGPLVRVMFPALSEVSESSTEFIANYKQATIGTFMLLSPVCIGLALTATEVIPIILGNQWLEVIPPMQFILVALTLNSIGLIARSAAMAKGKTRLIFFQSLFVNPFKILLFITLVSFYGLMGAVYAIVIGTVILSFSNIYIGSKVTSITVLDHFRFIKKIIAALGIMILSVILCQKGIIYFSHDYSLATHLILKIIVGASFYIVSIYFFWCLSGRPYGPETMLYDRLTSLLIKRK